MTARTELGVKIEAGLREAVVHRKAHRQSARVAASVSERIDQDFIDAISSLD